MMGALETARQNLLTAKSNLVWRISHPKDYIWLSYQIIEAEEDIAKWERIIQRLEKET